MSYTNKTLITIVGPTAIGKTSLSIAMAKHFNTEIISCDSRQFYKEMNIGTAIPTEDELNQVQHHFIQDRSIHNDYNVGDYEKDALEKLRELFSRFDVVIMVGGRCSINSATTLILKSRNLSIVGTLQVLELGSA